MHIKKQLLDYKVTFRRIFFNVPIKTVSIYVLHLVCIEHTTVTLTKPILFDNSHFLVETSNITDTASTGIFRSIDPSFVLDLLNQIKAKGIIEQPFFLHTNKLHVRTIQDLPLFNDPRPVKRRDVVPARVFSVTPFYAHISHAVFYHKGDDLKDYLALDDTTVLSAVHDVFDALKQFNDQFFFDTNKVFNSLKNGSVEQRRVGILFEGEGRLGECSIAGSIPLYYLERNFQLSKKDKKSLEEEFGATTEDEQEKFKKKHLIFDTLGVGDLRIDVALPVTESWKEHFKLSFFTTLPLGGSFVKGIMGSSYTGSPIVPTLDIDSLITMIIENKQAEAFAVVNNLALDALDRLSATLLEQSLTNERHVGIGIGVINRVKLKDFFKGQLLKRWHWNYDLSCQYYIPSKHHRSFINKIDYEKIADLNLTDPQNPEETLQIFTQEALDRFFLRSFKAKIHPGVVVRSYSTFVYKHQQWRVWFGSDLWFKSAEKVVFLDTSSAIQAELDRHKVKNAYGLALSSILGFSYGLQRENSVIDIGLDAYSSWLTRGIGQEMGVAFKIAIHF